ncbi:TlpA family protein disulfide reductase [Candidatus Poribacteria bacterium]|nr:TlpA family protein disulfide reductase [Candidatus Poribacteria bacterium]
MNKVLLVLLIWGCTLLNQPARAENTHADDASTSSTAFPFPAAGEARTIELSEVRRLVAGHGHDLLVLNLWATWCAPCVKELPAFAETSKAYADKGVLFTGFSLDFADEWEQAVPPFLKKKGIPYPNFVLLGDPNELVPFFSADWAGDIPATFFYDRSGKKLGEHLGPVEKAELEKLVTEHLAGAREEHTQ